MYPVGALGWHPTDRVCLEPEDVRLCILAAFGAMSTCPR
jgi:hypothetical protein